MRESTNTSYEKVYSELARVIADSDIYGFVVEYTDHHWNVGNPPSPIVHDMRATRTEAVRDITNMASGIQKYLPPTEFVITNDTGYLMDMDARVVMVFNIFTDNTTGMEKH